MYLLYFSHLILVLFMFFFFFQAEDGIRDLTVTGVQTCALPISAGPAGGLQGVPSARPARRHPAHEAIGEAVGLPLRVGPEHVVPHLVVDGLDPLPLRVVLAAALPALRMHEVDLAVLVGAPDALAPVEPLVPVDPWHRQVVEAAHRRDGAPERRFPMRAEERGEHAVHRAALPQ